MGPIEIRPSEIMPTERRTGVYWEPEPDITVYELALALAILLQGSAGVGRLAEHVEQLPDEVRRHFTVR